MSKILKNSINSQKKLNNPLSSKSKIKSNQKEESKEEKTPKEILALLLKNSLGKNLFKLEKKTKEQRNDLKEISKYYIFFEKKLLAMESGVERKKKEDERKQKMARKTKITATPSHIRSKTVQNLRKNNLNKDNNTISKTSIKTNPNMKIIFRKKTSGNLNLENAPKIRSKTVGKNTRYNTNSNTTTNRTNRNSKVIKEKDNININTPKRTKNDDKDKDKNITSTISRKDSRRISKSRKGTIHRIKEDDKTDEKTGIRRKSIHRIIKKHPSAKKLIKNSEERNKNNNNINITTNINAIKNFGESTNQNIENDENIKNINIDEILNNANKIEKNEIKETNNVLLKELEELNERKPRMEDTKSNNIDLPRNRSRSKNKDDNMSEYQEMKGSLKDMQIMLDGLNKMQHPEKKIKFEKKKRIDKKEDSNNNNINNINNNDIINNELNDLFKPDNNIKLINNNNTNILIGSIILPPNLNENKEKNNNNENKFIKESQIMNAEIINTIENDKNILNNSLLENNIISLNKNIEKNDIKNNEENKNNFEEKKIDEEKVIKEEKKEENIIQKFKNEMILNEEDKEMVMEKEKKNELNEKENNNEENNKIISEEKKELIQSGSRIMSDEQLVDPNQSSLMFHSSIMAEDYILISRDPDAPFSIEDTLKFEKKQILSILDYLTFKEKINLTGINRVFNMERIFILNNKREELIRSMDLSPDETIDDIIMKTKLKYSNEELSKKFIEFQVSRGAIKAVELLNNQLYSKLFKKKNLEKNSDEICKVYRTLFVLFDEIKIALIPNDDIFWIKCTEYLNDNSGGKIGTFILEKFKKVTFDNKKIVLMDKFLIGLKKKINPNYFSKICGTTGLLIFLLKDALEYCGVIVNEKKTQPARILDNLMYYKNATETLAMFIEYLSGLKTYKIREKKINKI